MKRGTFMGDAFFNFSLWDIISHPVLKLTGKAAKLGASALISTSKKADNAAMAPSELIELLQDAQSGDSHSQALLALHYAGNDDYEKFTYWISKSAEQGDEFALEIMDSLQWG